MAASTQDEHDRRQAATSVLAVGATPVLVDMTPESRTISPAAAAERITPATRAMVAVDVLGHPAH